MKKTFKPIIMIYKLSLHFYVYRSLNIQSTWVYKKRPYSGLFMNLLLFLPIAFNSKNRNRGVTVSKICCPNQASILCSNWLEGYKTLRLCYLYNDMFIFFARYKWFIADNLDLHLFIRTPRIFSFKKLLFPFMN